MKVVIANDHAAVGMKDAVMAHIRGMGHECEDYGAKPDEDTDYPVLAERVARLVADGSADRGVLICGTGVGMGISANKVHGIRAVICSEPYTANFSRRHNDTNILCFGARVVAVDVAKTIVDAWLETPFEGGRHGRRVGLLNALDDRERG